MLMGNLTADPEIKQLPSGMQVGELRLAVSEKFKNKSGEDVETVVYINVVVWGRQAETCGQYLSKGSPVFVEGRLQLDQWEKDGQKRSKIRVRADRVQFVGGKGGNGKGGGEGRKESNDFGPLEEMEEPPF
jgi:single-strand DNA-binding protein